MADFLSPERLEALRKESPEVQAQVLDKYFPTLKMESPEVQAQVRQKYGLTTGPTTTLVSRPTTPSQPPSINRLGRVLQGTAPKWGQENPNLYGVAGAARETLGPLAQALGFIGGGIIGEAAQPLLGGLLGAGLGTAAINRGLHSADVALGNVPPMTMGEQAKTAGTEAVQGARDWALASILPKMVTINPEERLNVETLRRLRLKEATGVPLTRADVTGKKSDALIEAQLYENIGSANTAQQVYKEKLASLDRFAKTTGEGLGGRTGALEAGQTAQAEGRGRYAAFMKEAGEKYKAIPSSDIAVETPKLRDVAVGHMDELGQMQSSATKRIVRLAQESIDRETQFAVQREPFIINKDFPQAYTLKTLLDDYSTLGKMARATSDYNKKRIFNSLREAMLDDIADFSSKTDVPAVKDAVDAAMKFYKEGDARFPGGINTFRDRVISNALKTNSPEDIVGKFMKPRNVSDIARLKNAVGTEGFQSLKQAWFERLITSGEEQTISPAKFVSAVDKYDAETLNAILTPSERDGFQQLYDISKIIRDSERLGANPSGTGRTVLNSAYMWMRHPVYQTLTQLTTNRMAKWYFGSNHFRGLVTEGLKLSPLDPRAVAIGKKLSQIAGGAAVQEKVPETIRAYREATEEKRAKMRKDARKLPKDQRKEFFSGINEPQK